MVVPRGRSILGRDALAGLVMKVSCAGNGSDMNTIEEEAAGLNEFILKKRFPKVF